jgi:hypothetical protein
MLLQPFQLLPKMLLALFRSSAKTLFQGVADFLTLLLICVPQLVNDLQLKP